MAFLDLLGILLFIVLPIGCMYLAYKLIKFLIRMFFRMLLELWNAIKSMLVGFFRSMKPKPKSKCKPKPDSRPTQNPKPKPAIPPPEEFVAPEKLEKDIIPVKREPQHRAVSLTCVNCGAGLEFIEDRFMTYCPYCGHKVLIDIDVLGEILSRKEATRKAAEYTRREELKNERSRQRQEYELKKRQMENEAEERREKQKWLREVVLWIGIGAFLLINYLLLLFSEYF